MLASLRSFAATRAKEDQAILWNGVVAHVVVIVAVPQKLDTGAKGFPIRLIDPAHGCLGEAYVRIEDIRGFSAIRGSGKEFAWLDRGFLQVDAPRPDREPTRADIRARH